MFELGLWTCVYWFIQLWVGCCCLISCHLICFNFITSSCKWILGVITSFFTPTYNFYVCWTTNPLKASGTLIVCFKLQMTWSLRVLHVVIGIWIIINFPGGSQKYSTSILSWKKCEPDFILFYYFATSHLWIFSRNWHNLGTGTLKVTRSGKV